MQPHNNNSNSINNLGLGGGRPVLGAPDEARRDLRRQALLLTLLTYYLYYYDIIILIIISNILVILLSKI